VIAQIGEIELNVECSCGLLMTCIEYGSIDNSHIKIGLRCPSCSKNVFKTFKYYSKDGQWKQVKKEVVQEIGKQKVTEEVKQANEYFWSVQTDFPSLNQNSDNISKG
jgi:hypothetical protein